MTEMTANVVYLSTRAHVVCERRRYHTLLVRERGVWTPAFGAFERNDVEAERDDYVDGGWRKKDTKIITTDAGQDEIDACVLALNERGA